MPSWGSQFSRNKKASNDILFELGSRQAIEISIARMPSIQGK